jgi:hypothetical protein
MAATSHRRRRRLIVAGVVVGLLAIAGTSLAVNRTFLQGRWDAARASSDLAHALLDVDGVRSASAEYSPLGVPDPATVVHVTFSPTATPSAWGRADRLIRRAARSTDLSGTTTSARFTSAGGETATVEPLVYGPGTVTAEVAAWRSLDRAVGGGISLHLGTSDPNTGATGRYYRVTSVDAMRRIAARWPDDASVPDTAVTTSFTGPGIQLVGMPTAPEMATLAAVADHLPLASADAAAKQTGTMAVVLGDVRGFKVQILPMVDGEPQASAPDRAAAEATSAAFASGASRVEWFGRGHDASLVAGDCGTYRVNGRPYVTTLRARADDAWFADAVTRAGLRLPEGVRVGTCAATTD